MFSFKFSELVQVYLMLEVAGQKLLPLIWGCASLSSSHTRDWKRKSRTEWKRKCGKRSGGLEQLKHSGLLLFCPHPFSSMVSSKGSFQLCLHSSKWHFFLFPILLGMAARYKKNHFPMHHRRGSLPPGQTKHHTWLIEIGITDLYCSKDGTWWFCRLNRQSVDRNHACPLTHQRLPFSRAETFLERVGRGPKYLNTSGPGIG